VRAAIMRLPDEYREPLVLQVLMGYSTAEIARELDLSGPAVLTRLCRARQRLRAACGEDTTLDAQE
jgi:RNA polymerase sigma-70 factor, ECF subfamily